MRRPTRKMAEFRRRLVRLIDQQDEGLYTRAARRARIPVSSMQHILHNGKYLPGGEQLLRLAEAFGVSVEYLVTGREALPPEGHRP